MGEELFRLYSRPTFFEGVARLFDINGLLNQYNYSHTEEEADYRAIHSDWAYVGKDISEAIIQFRKLYVERDNGQ
jgi:hypothetical protein